MNHTVLETLAADYPQLYLNPDQDSQEAYKRVVLQGQEPAVKTLAHYQGDAMDRLETLDTPPDRCGLRRWAIGMILNWSCAA